MFPDEYSYNIVGTSVVKLVCAINIYIFKLMIKIYPSGPKGSLAVLIKKNK